MNRACRKQCSRSAKGNDVKKFDCTSASRGGVPLLWTVWQRMMNVYVNLFSSSEIALLLCELQCTCLRRGRLSR